MAAMAPRKKQRHKWPYEFSTNDGHIFLDDFFRRLPLESIGVMRNGIHSIKYSIVSDFNHRIASFSLRLDSSVHRNGELVRVQSVIAHSSISATGGFKLYVVRTCWHEPYELCSTAISNVRTRTSQNVLA
jgi:hypothetical protein